MIYAKTWRPGRNDELDKLFDTLRDNVYQDQTHELWQNYSKDRFKHCVALTISFDNDIPLFCSSIANKTPWHHWPDGVYRIMNRYWRVGKNHNFLKRISKGSGVMAQSQLNWLKENTDYELAFISRQTDNWQEFMINSFKNDFDIDFKMDNYIYCTCETPNDDSCWQKIIYTGNPDVLETWKRR